MIQGEKFVIQGKEEIKSKGEVREDSEGKRKEICDSGTEKKMH